MHKYVRLALPLVAAATLAACSSSGSGEPTSASSSAPATSPAAAASSPAASASTPESADTGKTGGTRSGEADSITFTTNYGPITVALDPDAPKTIAAQTKLAEDGYFDGTKCHRVVTQGIYVLQCGDPTATGTGDPGYTLPDENLPQVGRNNYPAGTVAMANAGPGTSGSQFFIVYDDTVLPPAYTIWGTVTDGLEEVKAIGKENADAGVSDGPPVEDVTIESTEVASG
jgi:peptidyl-prolyl cis-trans isomerase B (cyclophilin B)